MKSRSISLGRESKRGRIPCALLGVAVALVPRIAVACPVCFAAKNEANRAAFVDMTIFMTVLPLVMLGACLAWFVRKERELEQSHKDAQALERVAHHSSQQSFRLSLGSARR